MQSSTEYTAFEDATEAPMKLPARILTVALAVAMGLGVHAEKESLAPAEPALESLGLCVSQC